MPSYGGAHGPDGSKKSGDQGQGSRDSRGGNTGGAKGQGGSGFGGAFGKQTTASSAALDHLVAIGKARAPSIPAGGVAQGNYPAQDNAYMDYSKAVGKHATRGFFDKALDWGLGGFYDPKEPMAGNPRSFAGGDFHSTTNPGSVLGGLFGMFGGPAGTLVGKLAGPAYTAAGLPEIWHGGYSQPDLRAGPLGNTTNPMGATMADIGGGHTYASGSTPGMGGVGRPSFAGGGTGNSGYGNPGLGGGLMAQGQRPVPGVSAPAAMPGMAANYMPGQQLSVGGVGLPSYGAQAPGYSFYGGQQGGIRPGHTTGFR
jgi:hypothetical protein